MILLQEAMMAGVVFLVMGAGSIFIGIPLLTFIIHKILLSKNTSELNKKERFVILIKSLLIAIAIIAVFLYIMLRIIGSSLAIS